MDKPTDTMEEKADRLYRFIYDELKDKAQAPSHREMAAHLGCSWETMVKVLNYLEESGRGLQRVRGLKRRLWVPIHEMREE